MHSIRFLCKNLKNGGAIEVIFASSGGAESKETTETTTKSGIINENHFLLNRLSPTT